jgi:hypothetical protein
VLGGSRRSQVQSVSQQRDTSCQPPISARCEKATCWEEAGSSPLTLAGDRATITGAWMLPALRTTGHRGQSALRDRAAKYLGFGQVLVG